MKIYICFALLQGICLGADIQNDALLSIFKGDEKDGDRNCEHSDENKFQHQNDDEFMYAEIIKKRIQGDTTTEPYMSEETQLNNSVHNVKTFFLDLQQKIRDSQLRLRQLQNMPYLKPYLDSFGDSTRFEVPTISLSNYVMAIDTTLPVKNVSGNGLLVSSKMAARQFPFKPPSRSRISPTAQIRARAVLRTRRTKSTVQQDVFVRQGTLGYRPAILRRVIGTHPATGHVLRRAFTTAEPNSEKPRRSQRARRSYYKQLKKRLQDTTSHTLHYTQKTVPTVPSNNFKTVITTNPSKINKKHNDRKTSSVSSCSEEETSSKVDIMDQPLPHGEAHKNVIEEPIHSDNEVILKRHLYKALKNS